MTIPNREAEALAAAEAWAATCTDKYFTDRTRSSWQSIHKDMSDAFMAGCTKGLEEAAGIAREHGDGYQQLRRRAKDDHDKEGAVAHLCEAEAAYGIAQAIRRAGESIRVAAEEGK